MGGFAEAAAVARQLLSRQSARAERSPFDDLKTPSKASPDGDGRRCRYCFGGPEDGELIAPCRCDGGQKYVHVECLRKWERTVMLQQPTHPSCYGEDDRYLVCHVCTAAFDIAPPPRHELMASLAGETLAKMLSI